MVKTLEDGLRLVLLEQYGFERALKHSEISAKGLKLIEQTSDDLKVKQRIEEIQHEREVARQQREYGELQEAIEHYPKVHVNSMTTSYFKKNYEANLFDALPTASPANQRKIREALGDKAIKDRLYFMSDGEV